MQIQSRRLLCAATAAVSLISASSGMAALYYAPVVTIVGNGSTAIASGVAAETTIAVYADGTAGQTTAVASATYAQSTAGLQTVGSNTTEGQLANNPALADAAATDTPFIGTAYAYSAGYAAAAGQTAVATGNTYTRAIGYVNVTSTSVTNPTQAATMISGAGSTAATSYGSGNIRGAVGDDNATTLYAAGSNSSYHYVPNGSGVSGTDLYNNPANVRQVEIRNGQLYGSADTSTGGNYAGIQQIGTGLPNTGSSSNAPTSSIVLTSSSNSSIVSPESFVFIDDTSKSTPATDTISGVDSSGFAAVPYNVIYIADAQTQHENANGSAPGNLTAAPATSAPGIQKWVYNSANAGNGNGGWTLEYIISDGTLNQGYYGVAGQEDGAGDVVLYGTTDATTNSLEEFTDSISATTLGVNDDSEVTLATAPTDDNFRGVALAPVVVAAPEPAALSMLGLGAIGLLGRRRK